MSNSLEAKIVVLGSQGVGKTSLVNRYVKNAFAPPASMTSTIGASFLTKRVADIDSSTVVRLQIWDTAGQERFRSISKLYYRGANAALLCYDITSASSFAEMGHWLVELRANLPEDTILHVVGTKADIVAEHASMRKVPFERCIAYVAEHLYPASTTQTPSHLATKDPLGTLTPVGQHGNKSSSNLLGGRGADNAVGSPDSNRSSMGFWGQDLGWDCCHEVSASTGEGVEEVFRVITRRLVEQRNSRAALEARLMESAGRTSGVDENGNYYNEYGSSSEGGYPHGSGNGSFRVGIGDKRRSWLGIPQFPSVTAPESDRVDNASVRRRRGPCCT